MLKNPRPRTSEAAIVSVDRAQAAKTAVALKQALKKSVKVKDKVEECALELSAVNAALSRKVTSGEQSHSVKRVLDVSENIEAKALECVQDLAVVNDALEDEVRSRKELELDLLRTSAALLASQAREKTARHSALHDLVTGLPNLALFNDRLTHAIDQARRHAWQFAVMFIDLDHFKLINDTHGHDVGDEVLRFVAQRLKAVVRSGDTVSRRSGDEFLFLMLEVKDTANVQALALDLVEHIGQPCEIDGVTLSVASSIGVACYPSDGESASELLKFADMAMYAAKGKKTGVALN